MIRRLTSPHGETVVTANSDRGEVIITNSSHDVFTEVTISFDELPALLAAIAQALLEPGQTVESA